MGQDKKATVDQEEAASQEETVIEETTEESTDQVETKGQEENADEITVSADDISDAEETPVEEEKANDPQSLLEAKNKKLEQKIADADDKYKRSAAEFENFKRRSRQELQTKLKFAQQPLANTILPCLDTLDRALTHASEHTTDANEFSDFIKGVEMVRQQFVEALGKNEIAPIDALGKAFDPNLHEAIGMVDSDEVEPEHIAVVLQAGYTLHDRVIRPAMVQVANKK
ncbi:MAG: molecular chaperone GrpE [bacterium]|jgi:molecular chaperone GrpE